MQLEQDHEFVAPQPSQQVEFAYHRDEALPQLLQHAVAAAVAVGVVDFLKIIQVEQEQGAIELFHFKTPRDLILHRLPVQQAGQLIMVGAPVQLLLQPAIQVQLVHFDRDLQQLGQRLHLGRSPGLRMPAQRLLPFGKGPARLQSNHAVRHGDGMLVRLAAPAHLLHHFLTGDEAEIDVILVALRQQQASRGRQASSSDGISRATVNAWRTRLSRRSSDSLVRTDSILDSDSMRMMLTSATSSQIWRKPSRTWCGGTLGS